MSQLYYKGTLGIDLLSLIHFKLLKPGVVLNCTYMVLNIHIKRLVNKVQLAVTVVITEVLCLKIKLSFDYLYGKSSSLSKCTSTVFTII